MPVSAPDVTPVTYECFHQEAARQSVPPMVLMAIRMQEAGRPGMASPNKNGTYDLGPFQVNTIWVAEIAKQTHLTWTQSAYLLRNNGCFNVSAAAWVLRIYINEAGGDVWKGVSYYHSHLPEHGNKYLAKVATHYRRLQSMSPGPATQPSVATQR